MRSDIQLAFENSKSENRPALLTYTVAADPNIKKSLQILNSIAKKEFAQVYFLMGDEPYFKF